MGGLSLYTAPAVEPISLDEAKLHLRVDITDDDALITSLITAARQYSEMYTRRQFCTATWDLSLDDWPEVYNPELAAKESVIYLYYPPIQSITSITYYDSNNVSQTLAASYYELDSKSLSPKVVPAYNESWPLIYPRTNAITVRYAAGYGGASSVPASIRQAMLLLIGHWYEHRESVIVGTITSVAPQAVDALLWANRVLDY